MCVAFPCGHGCRCGYMDGCRYVLGDIDVDVKWLDIGMDIRYKRRYTYIYVYIYIYVGRCVYIQFWMWIYIYNVNIHNTYIICKLANKHM